MIDPMATQPPQLKPDASGLYHFKLEPTGRTFAMREPTFIDLKRAHSMCPPPSGNVYLDGLNLGEQLTLLILEQVDGQPVDYQSMVAAGGLGGMFKSVGDAQAVINVAQTLRDGGAHAGPLTATTPSGGTSSPTPVDTDTSPSVK